MMPGGLYYNMIFGDWYEWAPDHQADNQPTDTLHWVLIAALQFFADLWHLVRRDCFIEDFSTIALQAPEIMESFIQDSFIHVGKN